MELLFVFPLSSYVNIRDLIETIEIELQTIKLPDYFVENSNDIQQFMEKIYPKSSFNDFDIKSLYLLRSLREWSFSVSIETWLCSLQWT